MDKLEIIREWEKEFMHEAIPVYHWRTLLTRLAGNPYDTSGHHPMCLTTLGRADDCPHCGQLRKDV